MTLINQTDNIYFINAGKTFAIFLFILLHLSIPNDIYLFINRFHLSLFYFVIEHLMGVDTVLFKKMIVKKAHTLLLSYFLFAFISFFLFLLLKNYTSNVL
jgi:hypothetical protein